MKVIDKRTTVFKDIRDIEPDTFFMHKNTICLMVSLPQGRGVLFTDTATVIPLAAINGMISEEIPVEIINCVLCVTNKED